LTAVYKTAELRITKNPPVVKMEIKIDELIKSVEFMGKQSDVFNTKVD